MNDIQLRLSLEEINTVLEALGQMPYVRVHQLIAGIHQQATAQVRAEESRAEEQGERIRSAS